MTKTEIKNELRNILFKIATTAAETVYYTWDNEFSRKQVTEVVKNTKGVFNKKVDLFDLDDFRQFTKDELIEFGFGNWDGELVLIPLYLVSYINPDSTVVDIFDGEKKLKDLDLDQRFGCIAAGFYTNEKKG